MKDYRSTTVKAKDMEGLPTNPIFDGLSDDLKTLEAFEKVEKDINKIMISDHKHLKIQAFVKCKRCKDKMIKRRKKLESLGFKDYHQYLTWKKVITMIRDKHE